MFKWAMVTCFVVATLCVATEAKETTINKQDHGLADVVQRECKNILWTSEVMKLTPLDSTDLTQLKVGDKVWIPDNCATKPSKEIERATLRIFKNQRLLLQAKKLNKNLIKVTGERDAAIVINNNLGQQNKEVKMERDVANTRAKNLEQQNKELAKHKSSIWLFVVCGIVGAIMAFVAYWFLNKMWRQKLLNRNLDLLEKISSLEEELKISKAKQEELRQKLIALSSSHEAYMTSVTFHGQIIEFRDTSEHFVGCPFCSERKIGAHTQNMIAHLNKVHTFLRVVQITPEEMKRKMALAVS